MTSSQAPNQVSPVELITEDEIDLSKVFMSLVRQKKLIATLAGGALLFSCVVAFTRDRIWQGEFQIVLENQDSSPGNRLAELAAANPMFANLAGVAGNQGSQLETEVKVLKSPSVLKPTFEFVKASKVQKGIDVSDWSFSEWRDENLEIELEDGTSVLNIAYRDTDVDLVLPVIERISNDYQLYSGRDRQGG